MAVPAVQFLPKFDAVAEFEIRGLPHDFLLCEEHQPSFFYAQLFLHHEAKLLEGELSMGQSVLVE